MANEKYWDHLTLKDGSQVKFVPPAPNGAKLGGISATDLEQISTNKNHISALSNAEDGTITADHEKRITTLENGSGVSDDMKNTLLAMFKACAYAESDVSSQLSAFKEAWGIIDLVMLKNTGIGYYTASAGMCIFESLTRESLVAASGIYPLSSSAGVYAESEYYPPYQIPKGATSFTFSCEPNSNTYGSVYCGYGVVHWNGSVWQRDYDGGWGTLSGWTTDVSSYNDGNYYITCTFMNSWNNNAIQQLTIDDVSFSFK